MKQKEKAIALLAEGELKQSEIAVQTGVSQPTVSRLKNDDDVKRLIEDSQERLYVKSLEMVVNNTLNLIKKAGEILSDPDLTPERIHECKTLLELAAKKETQIAQGAGLIPSKTSSIAIQNIFNQQNQFLESGEYCQYLAWKQKQESKYTFDIVEPEAKDTKGNPKGGH